MRKKPVIVYACLSSYVGRSMGAIHTYLKLKWYDENEEVHNEEIDNFLTIKQAKELNKADREKYPEERYMWSNYKKGEAYGGFWSEEEAIKKAIEVFKEKFDKENDILFQEVRGTCIFGKTLYCENRELDNKLTHLYNRAENIGWWDDPKNDKIMDQLDKEYEKLIL